MYKCYELIKKFEVQWIAVRVSTEAEQRLTSGEESLCWPHLGMLSFNSLCFKGLHSHYRTRFWGYSWAPHIWTSPQEHWTKSLFIWLSFSDMKRHCSSKFKFTWPCASSLTFIPHFIYSLVHLSREHLQSATNRQVGWVLRIQLSILPSEWFYRIRT
jgi:hypothetical protein